METDQSEAVLLARFRGASLSDDEREEIGAFGPHALHSAGVMHALGMGGHPFQDIFIGSEFDSTAAIKTTYYPPYPTSVAAVGHHIHPVVVVSRGLR